MTTRNRPADEPCSPAGLPSGSAPQWHIRRMRSLLKDPVPHRSGRFVPASMASLCFSAVMVGCAVGVPQLSTPDSLPAPSSGPLKAHLHSGELVVFERWEEDVEARALVGTARRYGVDREPRPGPYSIRLPVDSIALLETVRSSVDGYGLGLTLLGSYTVLTGWVTLVCMADPKTCFGSCPTFYIDDSEGGELLRAEGFSASVARALEASDLDDLRWTIAERSVRLRMRNEALETHAIRGLRLYAVPEPAGGRVFATPEGRFLLTSRQLEPIGCAAPEGDCLEEVRAPDGRERRTWTDPGDLGDRETIELEFPITEGRVGLVVAARHTFVSTYLNYQMLAFLGSQAGPFLASLEREENDEVERIRGAMGRLGRLEILVQHSDGTWQSVGAFEEAGPLATDVQLFELPPSTDERPLRVRLELAKGFWRLEHVALVEIERTVEPAIVAPSAAERLRGAVAGPAEAVMADPAALEALLDPDRYLVTEPGDHYRFTFELPRRSGQDGAHPERHRIFLESTGHYYQWMRAEWRGEESLVDAGRMLLEPEVMFRRLAPAFKMLESEMEEAFWNSRFRR